MPLAGRERAVTFSIAGAFLLAAAGLVAGFTPAAAPDPVVLAVLLAAYTIAARIEFEVGPGSAVPTQLVLVPALFLLSPVLVPPIVAAGYILSGLPEYVSGRRHPDRMFVALASSWHPLGPAVVLTLTGSRGPVWAAVPVYAGALGAQFALDTANAIVREWLGFGVPLRRLLGALAWVFIVDTLLAPAGLLAAFASRERQ